MREAIYSGTRNLYPHMATAVKSLIANSPVERVWLLIEDEEFPHELPDIVRCHDVSSQTLFPNGGPNMTSRFSYMALMRAALCHVIDADAVLSLDCDTICRRDVTPIWDLPIDDCYFSATPEWHRSKNGLQYCNAGVTLFNLKKLRELVLDANQLSTLPETLSQCDNLETISVVENPMEGGVPRILLDKKGLKVDQ